MPTAGEHAVHVPDAPGLAWNSPSGHPHTYLDSSNLTAAPLAFAGHGSPQDFPAPVGTGYSPDVEHAVIFVPSHVAPEGQASHPSVESFQYLPEPQVHVARPFAEAHIFLSASEVETLPQSVAQACL